ncbi:MAG: hypothetical protein ACRDRI_27220 [Pseudonocardiaceae bacterium]
MRPAPSFFLAGPTFTAAAREVSGGIATQPSPSAVIERLTGAMP